MASAPPDVKYQTGLVWFRRDLRVDDHAALSAALARCRRVWTVFVFDKDILDRLVGGHPRPDGTPGGRIGDARVADRRVEFIHGSLAQLDAALRARSGGLIVLHDRAVEAVPRLAAKLGVDAVFTNHDYEPTAIARDAAVGRALEHAGRGFFTFQDQAIFERRQLLTGGGGPYTVFTPYRNAWRKALDPTVHLADRDTRNGILVGAERPLPSLSEIGFEPTNLAIPAGQDGAGAMLEAFLKRVDTYQETRDYPDLDATSHLSVHLRFGTISIRRLVREALARNTEGAAKWLDELVWRDFYFQILANFPHVTGAAFRPAYDRVAFEAGPEAEAKLAAWCEGRTGYPLVDAAMLQLWRTGFMHNRLRMVTASFLTKDLGIHWSRGEAWFAANLNDFELSSNNGGWQWAASSGCDAQPYFRIFNPVSQSEKFDPDGAFIRKYVPALAGVKGRAIHAPGAVRGYPAPIVDHDEARRRTLERYAVVKDKSVGRPS